MKMTKVTLSSRHSTGLIFINAIFIALLCCACGKKSPSTSNEVPVSDQSTIDIPINVSLEHVDEYASNIRFKLSNEDEEILIEPTSTYYDAWTSSSRLQVANIAFTGDGSPTEYNEYPRLQCFIVNNTDQTLSINALTLCVESSAADPLPYIHIYAESAHSNTLTLVNENWVDWGKATLKYSLLKKGEEFNGQYSKQKTIPYFDDIYRVNFLDDMTEMGYDYNGLLQMVEYTQSDDDDFVFAYISDERFEAYSRAFYPFEIGTINHECMGFARLYGKLTFSGSNHEVEFSARLSLSTEAGFGAGMDEDDAFDVQLKTSGDSYTLPYPYMTSIAPGGSERVALTLRCNQSTLHHLYIEAVNDNGLSIRSKDINMHYLNPKHSSKNVWQTIKQYVQ